MEELTVYFNSSCSKSCSVRDILTEKDRKFRIVEYLQTPPTKAELKDILKKLNLPAEKIVRKKEVLFLQKFEGKQFTENEWLDILVQYPILLERPIVVKGDTAVIARPPENVNQIL